MKFLAFVCFIGCLHHSSAFVALKAPRVVTQRRYKSSSTAALSPIMSSTAAPKTGENKVYKGANPQQLRERAAALREELKGLEANAAGTRRPRDAVESEKAVPFPRTLLDSSWKVVLNIRGTKDEKNRVPVRLTFCTKFTSDDNILEVEKNHVFVKRGFVWEPERNPKDGKDYITFIAQVEGLSSVPDGKIYLNAYIDTIEDADGTKRYRFSDGAVTIKEVITQSFWGIFNTAGLLAQFKVVGTWDAFPIKDMPASTTSTAREPQAASLT